jgi:hypothetical protein
VALKTNQSGSIKYFLIKYSFEFIVIILGILVSLLLEQNRQNAIEVDRKNNTIKQLVNVIEDDINQIDGFLYLQQYSLNDLNNKTLMPEDSAVYHLSSVGRALRSFFPQQGIFDQLVSSDLIKMIDSEELKTKLFKLYNEDLRRHDVHTKEYDIFFLDYNYRLSENFFLQDSWVKTPNAPNPISIDSYKFNSEYYRSRKVFADIIESKSNIQSYINELTYLKGIFSNLKTLCLSEIGEA